MIISKPGPGQLIAGTAGAMLVISLFLPWASADGAGRSAWELFAVGDVFLLIVGLAAIATALTGGRFGVFRPDLSLNGATDLLGLVAIVLIAWFLIFDFPAGFGREPGAFLALAAAVAVAAGVGDYRPLHGAAWFPRIESDDEAS